MWGGQGYQSFQQWSVAPHNLECLKTFRRAITTATSWVHGRFVEEGCGWPWRLAIVGDERVGDELRMIVAEEVFRGPDEKLDYYFCKRLRAKLRGAGDLFEQELQDTIRAWAWSVRLGVSDVEYVHGRNHRRANAGMVWTSFAAQHVCAEARLAHEATKQAAKRASPVASNADARRTRRRTALDEFRFDWYAEKKAQGCKVNPALVWNAVKADFDSLSPDDKAGYDARARTSLTASQARKRLGFGQM